MVGGINGEIFGRVRGGKEAKFVVHMEWTTTKISATAVRVEDLILRTQGCGAVPAP